MTTVEETTGQPGDIDTDDTFRREVGDWLTANGIDLDRTPRHPDATLTDGQITLRQKIQRDGHAVVMGGEFATETVTVPLLVEPPPHIAAWLKPGCPTCGR